MTSVKFPDGFIALKRYPGYFWNPHEKRLYSIKVSGILTPLKVNRGFHHPKWTRYIGPHYQISNRGQRRYIPLDRIDDFLHDGEYVVQRELLG